MYFIIARIEMSRRVGHNVVRLVIIGREAIGAIDGQTADEHKHLVFNINGC